MITREFKLYLNAGVGVAPVINANQFDQDEEWIFTLLQSDGTVYTPSTGAIIGLKTDGTTILNAGTVNEDGQVVITETEQMTAVPGSNLFEILIDGNTHGTANFVVFVERRPGDIDHPSESDISLFQEAIDAAGNVTQFQADVSELKSDVSDLKETSGTLSSQIAQEASTRQTQDAVLQAEIDQIIAPSGEAPSAAEVANARIGANGTTYDTLGNAIRGQVGDLKNAFNEIEFETKNVEITPTAHAGYRYGYLDGALIESSGSTAWEFDATQKTDYILQGLQVGTSNTFAILFINSSDAVISIVNDAVQETGHLVPITTPIGCVKVKYTSSTNATWDANPRQVMYKTLEEQSPVANNTNSIQTLEKLIGNDYDLTNGYLDASGNLVSQSSVNKEVTTSFIPVTKGQVMNVKIEFNQARNAWCAFCLYDENETFIRRIADTQETTASKTWTYTVTANVAFVRLSYRTFGDIKSFSVYFDKSIFERLIPIENNLKLARKKHTRLMNRQGEGYGFPDNSIEGITSALNDGFSKIRVAIASTNDNVIYCTHSSEMKNNASANCLKLDGATYTENVAINDVGSAFIERLLYKNYPIPKLDEVMELVCEYDVELTLELKDTFTSAQAQILIDTINYYRVPVIISGLSADTQLNAITNLSTDMNIGVIFHYTDSSARYNINLYTGKCKTMRFDCFLGETITKESLTTIIHPNYKLKLGGSNPSASEIKELLKWVDVCETARQYSEYI